MIYNIQSGQITDIVDYWQQEVEFKKYYGKKINAAGLNWSIFKQKGEQEKSVNLSMMSQQIP